ncbi:MAG TPA: HlyD family type I secretion periplasmic adaptor subunit [Micropepsaceae bacterium]|nr:HlyD family type I secretion periplasmic adaptor subunit [Micropepsaceae bacterium]
MSNEANPQDESKDGGMIPRNAPGDAPVAASDSTRQMAAAKPAMGGALQAYTGGADGEPETSFMNPVRLIGKGMIVILVFVVGFFGWASFAQLESSVNAPGVIVVESHRKTIQHLEGGIVKEVLVAEGDNVNAGQPLLRLEETQAQSNFALLRDEGNGLLAQEARLIAERDGAPKITFPPELLAQKNDPNVASILAVEENTFLTRKNSLGKQIDILAQRNEQNKSQIAGLHSQQDAVTKQGALIDQEASGVEDLYKQGLSTLPRVLALRRQAADLTGQGGQITEHMAQIELNSEENNLQMTNLRNQQLTSVANDLRDVETKKYDVLARLNAAKDVMTRLDLVAPVSGKVVNLAIHTKGAVIKPGDTVMEIVPADDALEIEAHMRPDDADTIVKGMTAHVSFNSYKQRRLPQLTGKVDTVSADRLTDQRTGQPYFNVTVTVDRDALKDFSAVRLVPGLPADVAIATGTRTMMDYFLAPVLDVIEKGMREK